MTRTLPLLKQLLDLMAEFDQQAVSHELHLPGFIHWLLQRDKEEGNAMPAMPGYGQDRQSDDEGMTPEILLTMMVTYLFRYAKHYTKKALEGSPLSTLDDFTFLLTLRYQGSLTKSELISQHLLEITSGIEILKRLHKKGLVVMFDDPNDGRSKRVAITEAGSQVLEEQMAHMEQVSHVVAGNLRPEELGLILPALLKLNRFHQEIHQEDKKSELPMIVEKYLS